MHSISQSGFSNVDERLRVDVYVRGFYLSCVYVVITGNQSVTYEAAEVGAAHFRKVVQGRGVPDDVPEATLDLSGEASQIGRAHV